VLLLELRAISEYHGLKIKILGIEPNECGKTHYKDVLGWVAVLGHFCLLVSGLKRLGVPLLSVFMLTLNDLSLFIKSDDYDYKI
jgi:hypothetical protein